MKTGGRIKDVSVLVVDPRHPATVYAGSNGGDSQEPGDGVFKSTNGGRTWRAMNTGLGRQVSVDALAIDPQMPATLYAAANGRVFKSTDAGASWRVASAGLVHQGEAVSTVAVDPLTASTLYAGTVSEDVRVAAAGIYQSTDAGATWHPFNQGLRQRHVTAVLVAPTGNLLYAGTWGGGVFDYRFSG
jgi:photosystem II stability/assembly factor-like uncharacterized protein